VRNGYGEDHYLETVTVENGASDIVTSFGRDSVGNITSVTDPIWVNNAAHRHLDEVARRLLHSYGLAGGGCQPVGRTWYGGNAYPGC